MKYSSTDPPGLVLPLADEPDFWLCNKCGTKFSSETVTRLVMNLHESVETLVDSPKATVKTLGKG